MGHWLNGCWAWSFEWRRSLFIWEENLLLNLLTDLQGANVVQNIEDSWTWRNGCEPSFSVNSAYQVIISLDELNKSEYKFFWDNSIPLKVGVLCWRATLDRVPTKENLQKKGIIHDQSELLCCLCKQNLESGAHLFISCKFTYFVWMQVLNWFGISTALAGNLEALLTQFNGLLSGRGSRRVWRMLWFGIIWSIWLHRNDILLISKL